MKVKQYIGTKTCKAYAVTVQEAEEILGKVIDNDLQDEGVGYIVEYEDGYKSFYPLSAFNRFYRQVDGMTFGQAIEALKRGQKVARKGWNGKGMYLWLKPSTIVKSEWCKDPNLKELADANGGEILALGTICMYTHDSTGRKAILTGWLASQSDMLLEDWMIIE